MRTQILQLSDFHLLSDPAGRLRNVPTWQTLEQVLDLVRRDYHQCERIVITGDLAHDELRETYQRLREHLDELVNRCLFIPGNHDDRASMVEVLGAQTPAEDGKIGFDVRAGSWRLLGIDSHIPGEVAGRLADTQIPWLLSALADEPTRQTILFVHHPPIPVGSPWLDRIGLQDPEPLLEAMSKSPQLRIVACGHVHQDFVGSLGGAMVASAPSTAFQFCPQTETVEPDPIAPGFRVYEFEDSIYNTYVVRLPECTYPPDEA